MEELWMQAQWHDQIAEGFATMLQVPNAAIASVTFASRTQNPAARRLLAAGNGPSLDANASSASPAASAVVSTAAAAATQTVTVIVNPWQASNASGTSALGQGPLQQGPLTAPSAARLLSSNDLAQSQTSLGFAVKAVKQAYRIGICGNGLCEVGERAVVQGPGAGLVGSCPSDCPVPYVQCPYNGTVVCSGNGQCLSSQGTCNCYPGYESDPSQSLREVQCVMC